MPVVLPENIERQFTSGDLQLHLALGMFLDRRVPLGQGAAMILHPLRRCFRSDKPASFRRSLAAC